MKAQPKDRRAQRTCQMLRDALSALLSEKPYNSITVQDILDRANVGRSTFYVYYYDKEDLLVNNMEQVIDALGRHAGGGPLPGVALFRHLQEQYALYEALARGRGAEVLFKGVQEQISRAFEAHVAERLAGRPEPPVPLPLLADYYGGMFIWLTRWWLENKMPFPPERLDAIFRQLVEPGLDAALGDRRGEAQ